MQIICRSETLRAVHRPSQEPISAAHSCQATAAERHGRCTHLLCDRSGGAAAFEVAQAAAGVPKVLRDLQGAEVCMCSVRQVHNGSRHLWLVHAIADVLVAKTILHGRAYPFAAGAAAGWPMKLTLLRRQKVTKLQRTMV